MPKKDKTIYSEDSIKHIDGREFTRLRPATYLGSNEYSTQLVREVFSNSLDEHIIGHGDRIDVSIDTKCNRYTVEDYGQGFPINTPSNVEGETVLQASFDQINTSGKYDEDGVYGGSVLGLNGIGAKLTNYLSDMLIVTSYQDGKFEELLFNDGLFVRRKLGESDHHSGTTVTWAPDAQFFQDPKANVNDLRKLFTDIAALCPSLTINFSVDDKLEVFHSENGIQDLLDEKIGNKEILSSRFAIRKEVDNNLFDIAMTYTTDYSDNVIAYVNYGLTESGAHISAVKYLMTKCVNKYALDKGLIKKEADSFSSSELSEGLVIVFNLKAGNVKYDSQTKVRVVDLDKTLITSVINNDFPVWLENNAKDAKLIIERAMTARKAKEAAQKAKDGIRNAKGDKNKKFISLPTKLVDAYTKDRKECELFITEGDSAANGLIAKRDGKTQAVFPIRGKVLSCRKATPDKVYANQEISNIVKAIGLDIDKDTGKLKYDAKKLRYNKIVLATDADPDGAQIKLLLINMFWWLCPELVINKHIAVAVPPLFRVTTKKNEYVYLKDQTELDKYKKAHKESYLVNRMKGLGEMDPSELAYCLIKPESRNVLTITVEEANEADNMLECFMGDDVAPRRKYLLEHGNEVEVDME